MEMIDNYKNILCITSGGLLGAFVGMSILSMFEFLFWVLQMPWRICSKANIPSLVETRVTNGNYFDIVGSGRFKTEWDFLVYEILQPIKEKFGIQLFWSQPLLHLLQFSSTFNVLADHDRHFFWDCILDPFLDFHCFARTHVAVGEQVLRETKLYDLGHIFCPKSLNS